MSKVSDENDVLRYMKAMLNRANKWEMFSRSVGSSGSKPLSSSSSSQSLVKSSRWSSSVTQVQLPETAPTSDTSAAAVCLVNTRHRALTVQTAQLIPGSLLTVPKYQVLVC